MFKRLIILLAFLTATSPAMAATFFGEFWDASSPLSNLNDADAVISSQAVTSTFTSTGIDYPNGSTTRIGSGTTLANFLGSDAASIIGPSNSTLQRSVFRFTGFLELLAGPQLFTVGSDDGFRLTIGGTQISQRFSNRGFATTSTTVDAGIGLTAFELIFYENSGRTGIEFAIDNAIATPAPVPLPQGLPLIAAALGALMILRRKGFVLAG